MRGDAEELGARLAVYGRYPRAYQDYLGNIWTDDHNDCDSRCLSAIENIDEDLAYRQRYKANWLLAAERTGDVLETG